MPWDVGVIPDENVGYRNIVNGNPSVNYIVFMREKCSGESVAW